MRLGRSLTNTFTIEVLTPIQQQAILSGEESLITMNAWGIRKMKGDIPHLIDVARRLGIHHIELDSDVISPYPEFTKKQRAEAKKMFEDNGISISVHLPYSMSAVSNIGSPQELERQKAVEVAKVHLEFGFDVGAISFVVHPGKAPFYYQSPHYIAYVEGAIVKSLYELSTFVQENSDAKLHLENNTAFENLYSEPEDCIRVVKKVREMGGELYFNFDIGHWFTREKAGNPVPEPPEQIMETLPAELIWELHLNDFIVPEGIFHPPLVEQKGFLKRKNMENYARILKEKLKPELVVLETAFYSLEQIENREEILKAENKYISEIFGVEL